MFCALLTSRYQVSVYRTNGPLVLFVNRFSNFLALFRTFGMPLGNMVMGSKKNIVLPVLLKNPL